MTSRTRPALGLLVLIHEAVSYFPTSASLKINFRLLVRKSEQREDHQPCAPDSLRKSRHGTMLTGNPHYPTGATMNRKIAILIPCYNEELTVGQVVRDFRKQLPDADIYVFDNNSSDRTVEVARDAGARVAFEPRQGKGYVVQSMFREVDADIYVMVDGDDTY